MNTFDNEDQQVKDLLQQMPKVEDSMDKDVLYQNISSELRELEKPKKSNKVIWIPIGSAVVAVLLMILVLPPLFQNAMFESSNENSSSDALMDESATMEKFGAEGESGSELNTDEQNENNGNQESMPEVSLLDRKAPSNVVYQADDDSQIIHGALADTQGQYVIPFSVIAPADVRMEDYYNQLGKYLSEKQWGLNSFILEGAKFQLKQDENQVNITLPDNFDVLDGSTGPNLLEDTLTTMFTPYQINRVVFDREVNLGQIGKVEKLPLMPTKAIYKKYQKSDSNQAFLVRIPVGDNVNFSSALSKMKENEEVFHVAGVIPTDLNITVQREGPLLRLQFSNPENLKKSGETVFMLDAIMMTAKSFGYQQVEFVNPPMDTVGPYNLREPIDVPLGANPIYTYR
ncbi:hypothetical protein ACFO3D_04255 [Virgibacillus kekensis]|uniref:Negative regulator of sigma-X activity n=1 Tax=Virgibacillus kekensis TaxID=202261 RepID=A0ABV9DHY8_9BACI